MSGSRLLEKEVINVGLCTYCGTCVGACPQGVIGLDEEIEQPFICDTVNCPETCRICYDVCPGKDIPIPDLERMVFGRVKKEDENEIGIYKELYCAHATAPAIREAGASGGCGTALIKYAFEARLIDGAIIAAMNASCPWRGEARLITSAEEIFSASQSKYTMIPINAAFSQVRERNLERIMVTGLPCHIHGIRKAQALGLKLFETVKYTIGIVCGCCVPHEMTEHMVTELCGTELDHVLKVEYRGGQYPGYFRVTRKDKTVVSFPASVRRFFFLAFSRDRCTMCYDWGAELADIAIGDSANILPEQGSQGLTNIIIRTDIGEELTKGAESNGFIRMSSISHEDVIGNVGIEYKKHGFGYHLKSRSRWGWPVPDYHQEIRTEPLARKLNIPE